MHLSETQKSVFVEIHHYLWITRLCISNSSFEHIMIRCSKIITIYPKSYFSKDLPEVITLQYESFYTIIESKVCHYAAYSHCIRGSFHQSIRLCLATWHLHHRLCHRPRFYNMSSQLNDAPRCRFSGPLAACRISVFYKFMTTNYF